MPRAVQPGGEATDRHPVADHGRQRPEHRVPGELRPRGRGIGGVLAPDPQAVWAPVPADSDPELGGPPPQGDVGQFPQHRALRDAFAAAGAAPGIILTDPALKHCSLRFEVLAGDGQAERVDHAEGVEIRGGERRPGHVGVFRMGCVVTPIVGRPRPLSRHRHAQTTGTCLYTLICEEPSTARWTTSPAVPPRPPGLVHGELTSMTGAPRGHLTWREDRGGCDRCPTGRCPGSAAKYPSDTAALRSTAPVHRGRAPAPRPGGWPSAGYRPARSGCGS